MESFVCNVPDKFEVRPTLFIGFGGSGAKILAQAYQYLNELIEVENSRYVNFLIVDSDDPAKILDKHHMPRKYGHHFYYTDLNKFKEDSSYKFVAERRFPRYLGRLPVNSSDLGSGVCRLFGMCSLIDNMDQFEAVIDASLTSILDGPQDKIRTREEIETSFNDSAKRIYIYFVGSSAGGTASGMMLDAMALTRHYCNEGSKFNVNIDAVIVEPSVFVDDREISRDKDFRDQALANSYAFKKELNYYSENSFEIKQFPNALPTKVIRDNGLLDRIFLIESKTYGKEYNITSADDAFHTAAEMCFHFALSPIVGQLESFAPNIRDQMMKKYPIDTVEHKNFKDDGIVKRLSRRKLFSSFGVCSFLTPSSSIKRYLTASYTSTVVKSLKDMFSSMFSSGEQLHGKQPEATINENIQNDLKGNKQFLKGIHFEQEFKKMSNGAGNLNRVDLDDLEVGNLEESTNEILNQVRSANSKQLIDLEKRLDRRIQLWRTREDPVFTDLIYPRLNAPEFGINYVEKLIDALEEKINRHAEDFFRSKHDLLDVRKSKTSLRQKKLEQDMERVLGSVNKLYLKLSRSAPLFQTEIIQSIFVDKDEIESLKSSIRKSIREINENALNESIQERYDIFEKYIGKLQEEVANFRKDLSKYEISLDSLIQHADREKKRRKVALEGHLNVLEKADDESGERISYGDKWYENRRMKIVAREIIDDVERTIRVRVKEDFLNPILKNGFLVRGVRMDYRDILESRFSLEDIYSGLSDFIADQLRGRLELLNNGFAGVYYSRNEFDRLIGRLANDLYRMSSPLIDYEDRQGQGVVSFDYIMGYKTDDYDICEIFSRELKENEKHGISPEAGFSDECVTILRVVNGIASNSMRNILTQWRAYRKRYIDDKNPNRKELGGPLHIFSGAAQRMPELFTYSVDKHPFVDSANLIELAIRLGIVKEKDGEVRYDGVRKFYDTIIIDEELLLNLSKYYPELYGIVKKKCYAKNGNYFLKSYDIMQGERGILFEHEALEKLLNRRYFSKEAIAALLDVEENVDLATELIDECVYQIVYVREDQQSIIQQLEEEGKLHFISGLCKKEGKEISQSEPVKYIQNEKDAARYFLAEDTAETVSKDDQKASEEISDELLIQSTVSNLEIPEDESQQFLKDFKKEHRL